MEGKKKKSLEELANSVEKSIKYPETISLSEFENKIKKIARRFTGEDRVSYEGSHGKIRIGPHWVHWSPRRMGSEDVLSPGVLDKALKETSEATNISFELLELYFRGSGKPYKRYKREFEGQYEI